MTKPILLFVVQGPSSPFGPQGAFSSKLSGSQLSMAQLLVSLGMSKADAADIMNMINLPSEQELQAVLQRAAAGTAAVSGHLPGSSAVPPAEPIAPVNDSIRPAGLNDEDVPLYSRVTDDYVSGGSLLTLPPTLPPLSGLGGWLFGGSGGGNGGAGGGGKGGGPTGGGSDSSSGNGDAHWSQLCQKLLELLPICMAIAVVLPPAAIQRIISSLLSARAAPPVLTQRLPHALGLPALALSPRASAGGSTAGRRSVANGHGCLPPSGVGEAVAEWDPMTLLSSWPAAWLPTDGVSVDADASTRGVSDPAMWLRSAAGPPLPGSALSAVQWLSHLGATPQLLATRVSSLVAEAQASQEAEVASAARAMVAVAIGKVIAADAATATAALASATASQSREVDALCELPPPSSGIASSLDVAAQQAVHSSNSLHQLCQAISREGSMGGGDGVVMLALCAPRGPLASQVGRGTVFARTCYFARSVYHLALYSSQLTVRGSFPTTCSCMASGSRMAATSLSP